MKDGSKGEAPWQRHNSLHHRRRLFPSWFSKSLFPKKAIIGMKSDRGIGNDIFVIYFSVQVKFLRINVLLLAGTSASATRSLLWTARGREEEEGEETDLTKWHNTWHGDTIFDTVAQYYNSRMFHRGTQCLTQCHNIWHMDKIFDTVA